MKRGLDDISESREPLLELAAKAAGIVLIEWTGGNWLCERLQEDEPRHYWNPLTNDGDALRLAVKLNMETYHADDDGMSAYAQWPNARGYTYAIEPHGDDPCAATRRAIVRAAAEIGKAKTCQP